MEVGFNFLSVFHGGELDTTGKLVCVDHKEEQLCQILLRKQVAPRQKYFLLPGAIRAQLGRYQIGVS